jgi:hypothetical protein
MGPRHHVMERRQLPKEENDTEGRCEYVEWAAADSDKGKALLTKKSMRYKMLQARTDHLGRLEQCQINMRSEHGMLTLCVSRSLNRISVLPDVEWDTGGTEPEEDYTFLLWKREWKSSVSAGILCA